MNSLVSILIPAYNSEKWIRATIQSVLGQTWRNKEVIIVDDGSADDTLQIAKEFESRTVKVLSQSNRGACAARNRAFSVCQGDYVQWLDSDDLLAPDKIEVQLAGGTRASVLHSAAWGRFFFRLTHARFDADPLWRDLSPVDWLLSHLGGGYMMHPAAWLVSRRLSELAGGWDERLFSNQDGEYFCRVVANSEMVKFHPRALSYYRGGNASGISRNRSKEAMESRSLACNLSVDHLLRVENNEIAKKACVRFLNRSINELPPGDSVVLRDNQSRIAELGGTFTPSSKSAARRRVGLRLWAFEVAVRKNWDRLLSIVHGDGV